MLRNPRGGYSLRWLKALLDFKIEVHGQIVVCPGVNDGEVLDDSLLGVLDRFPELSSLAVVPLGVSAHNREPSMRPHTKDEAAAVIQTVEDWQERFLEAVGRRLVYAADEYYLLADKTFPEADTYEDFPMYEDGIGMARAFEAEFSGKLPSGTGARAGFFQWVDGAPAEGYRAPRMGGGSNRAGEIVSTGPSKDIAAIPVGISVRDDAPVAILTGAYGAKVLSPLINSLGRGGVRIVEVENLFFGGNVKVSGLMVGEDLHRTLSSEPEGHRYLLPDVCLNNGKFLDGLRIDDLPRVVEVVPTDGVALRSALKRGTRSAGLTQESAT
jgi:NifB/MoaA-like Fe-S oxidoreductase